MTGWTRQDAALSAPYRDDRCPAVLSLFHVSDDTELLDRWRAGDNEAGQALFHRHFRSICRFFENKISGDIDELVQATFLACVKARDRFENRCSFRTYLYTIARNELYQHLRRQHHEGQRLDFGVTSLVDMKITPRTRIAQDQDRRRLLQALRRLPVEQQVLLELHYWEELGPAELAHVFDIAQVTARTRLFRARAALREVMEQLSDKTLPEHQTVESLDAWARALRAEWARRELRGTDDEPD
jgi:RNA polymerase sigma factor (sigma-70 family)